MPKKKKEQIYVARASPANFEDVTAVSHGAYLEHASKCMMVCSCFFFCSIFYQGKIGSVFMDCLNVSGAQVVLYK